jgi:hypothetical protein
MFIMLNVLKHYCLQSMQGIIGLYEYPFVLFPLDPEQQSEVIPKSSNNILK